MHAYAWHSSLWGWGSCMVCGVTTPTNHMAKVESPPKDSRGVRKKERCLCTFSLGAGWLGTIVYRSTSACWQCTLHVYRLVAKQAAAAHAHLDMDLVACMHACMMHVCFSSILGAGFAPNTYQTTVQPKRFSLTLTFSISQIRCFGWHQEDLQKTTICMFSPIATISEHVCQFILNIQPQHIRSTSYSPKTSIKKLQTMHYSRLICM